MTVCDCGRITYWTGNRTSTRLRSEATYSRSRWRRSGSPSYQGMFSDCVTTLSPCSAEIGMNDRSRTRRRVANSTNSSRIDSNASSDQSTRSILLTHRRMWGTPSRLAMKAWRRLCSVIPRRASSRSTATSAVEAPVTMFRVYWMCPGVSAMMKRRFGVAKKRYATSMVMPCSRSAPLEVALALAVFHGRLADPIVAARRAALRDPDRTDLGHDLLEGVRVRLDRRGQVRVADRPVADLPALRLLAVLLRRELVDHVQHPVAGGHLALGGEVQVGDLDALSGDVGPDVELGPVREREDADALALVDTTVVEAPQLGSLVLRIPLPELIAEREHPLFRPGLLLVPTRPAEECVEAVLLDRLQEDRCLDPVARAVRFFLDDAARDRVGHGRHDQLQA